MSKELYLVNMGWEPHFLDPFVVAASRTQTRSSYEEYAGMLNGRVPKPFPLVALFKGHEQFRDACVVPDCVVPDRLGQRIYAIQNGQIDDLPLHEGLARILGGENADRRPIDLVVEFSRNPLYHAEIDLLAGRYRIIKVQIDVGPEISDID